MIHTILSMGPVLKLCSIFKTPWERIVNASESLAASHQTFAHKIESDIEQPLRNWVLKNREMQTMSTMQGNLASMAKEVDQANDRAEKLKKKGSKAASGKVASAAQDVEVASQQWDSQAPYIFEKLQEVDENRLLHLRDVLTQFHTHESDLVARNRETTENCLSTLLEVDPAEEVRAFSSKNTAGRSKVEKQRSKTAAGPALPASTGTDDASSQRSELSGGAGKSGMSDSVTVCK
jgi:hypothetical protein